MSNISLADANAIIAGVFAKGRELGLKPLTVAVLDAGGNQVAMQRSDNSPGLRPKIAVGKASGAIALGLSSRVIGDMAVERPHFIAALGSMADGGIVPVAGGVIALGNSGEPIGAVGVSGDTSDNDEICAIAGLVAAGLRSAS